MIKKTVFFECTKVFTCVKSSEPYCDFQFLENETPFRLLLRVYFRSKFSPKVLFHFKFTFSVIATDIHQTLRFNDQKAYSKFKRKFHRKGHFTISLKQILITRFESHLKISIFMPFRQPQLSHEITFLEHFEVFDCFTRIFQYFIVLFPAGNQIFSLFCAASILSQNPRLFSLSFLLPINK